MNQMYRVVIECSLDGRVVVYEAAATPEQARDEVLASICCEGAHYIRSVERRDAPDGWTFGNEQEG